jgi:hypothetical protein
MVHSTLCITLPYPFSPIPHFKHLSKHILISSTVTSYVLQCNLCSIILFSFHLSPSFIEHFHYYNHILHLSLYMIMLVFVYMFTFWIYLPHMRENMLPLYFLVWLSSLYHILQMHPFTFKPHVIIPYGWVKLNYVYMPHFPDSFISCRAPRLFLKLGYCVNSAVINISVQASLLRPFLHSFW